MKTSCFMNKRVICQYCLLNPGINQSCICNTVSLLELRTLKITTILLTQSKKLSCNMNQTQIFNLWAISFYQLYSITNFGLRSHIRSKKTNVNLPASVCPSAPSCSSKWYVVCSFWCYFCSWFCCFFSFVAVCTVDSQHRCPGSGSSSTIWWRRRVCSQSCPQYLGRICHYLKCKYMSLRVSLQYVSSK